MSMLQYSMVENRISTIVDLLPRIAAGGTAHHKITCNREIEIKEDTRKPTVIPIDQTSIYANNCLDNSICD